MPNNYNDVQPHEVNAVIQKVFQFITSVESSDYVSLLRQVRKHYTETPTATLGGLSFAGPRTRTVDIDRHIGLLLKPGHLSPCGSVSLFGGDITTTSAAFHLINSLVAAAHSEEALTLTHDVNFSLKEATNSNLLSQASCQTIRDRLVPMLDEYVAQLEVAQAVEAEEKAAQAVTADATLAPVTRGDNGAEEEDDDDAASSSDSGTDSDEEEDDDEKAEETTAAGDASVGPPDTAAEPSVTENAGGPSHAAHTVLPSGSTAPSALSTSPAAMFRSVSGAPPENPATTGKKKKKKKKKKAAATPGY